MRKQIAQIAVTTLVYYGKLQVRQFKALSYAGHTRFLRGGERGFGMRLPIWGGHAFKRGTHTMKQSELSASEAEQFLRHAEKTAIELVGGSPQESASMALCGIKLVNEQTGAVASVFSPPLYSKRQGGVLAGLPILAKSSAPIRGQILSLSCKGLLDYRASYTNIIVQSYQRAGATIIGKTSTPEFSTRVDNCSEAAVYPGRSALNPNATSGGSSGGASSAVAAGIVPIALGSDIAGSLRIPAACNGIFTLVPRPFQPASSDPFIPFYPYLNADMIQRILGILGPGGLKWVHKLFEFFPFTRPSGYVRYGTVTRTVLDCALAYRAASNDRSPEIFLEKVRQPPQQLVIGIMHNLPFADGDIDENCRAAVEDMGALCETQGHHIVGMNLKHLEGFNTLELIKAFAIVFSKVTKTSFEEFQRNHESLRETDLEPFNQIMVNIGKYTPLNEVLNAVNLFKKLETAMKLTMKENGVDLILAPTLLTTPVPYDYFVHRDREKRENIGYEELMKNPEQSYDQLVATIVDSYHEQFNFANTPAVNVSLLPAISLPNANAEFQRGGIYQSMQFIGSHETDELLLLRLAYQIEQVRPWLGSLTSARRRLVADSAARSPLPSEPSAPDNTCKAGSFNNWGKVFNLFRKVANEDILPVDKAPSFPSPVNS